MAVSLIASTKVTPASDSGGTSPAIDTTGATLIILAVSIAHLATPTCSDSKGNTYTNRGMSSSSGTNMRSAILSCANPVVGSGHTFTINNAGNNESMGIAAFSGAGAFNQFNSNFNNGSASSIATGSISTSTNAELVFAVTGMEAVGTVSIDSSLAIIDQLAFSAGKYYGFGMAWYEKPTPGSINPTWTTPTMGTQCAAIASFLGANLAFSRGFVFG